jgi:hypothetical protein
MQPRCALGLGRGWNWCASSIREIWRLSRAPITSPKRKGLAEYARKPRNSSG